MLKNIEDLGQTKKRITFEVPAEAFEQQIQKSFAELRVRTRIPGFRPGKAPLALIEKKFARDVEGEVMEKVIPQFYGDALKEAKVTPVTDPEIESGSMEFKRGEAMVITFTCEARPELGEITYDGITVTKISADITDKDIDETLGQLREERASFEPSEAAAKDDDLVMLDYDEKDGETVTPHKDQAFRVGADTMPLGFYEKVKGLKKGDTATVVATYPADHHASALAGSTITFEVTVKEVKNVILPELDDEFAKDLGLQSMAELRDKARLRLGEARTRTSRRVMKAEAMKKLIDRLANFDLPPSLVEGELGSMIDNARMMGRKDATEDALRAEFIETASRNVRASMVLQTIAEREKIDVTEQELRQKVVELAMEMRMPPENVMKYYISRDGSLDGLRHGVIEEKTLDFVLDKVGQVEEAK